MSTDALPSLSQDERALITSILRAHGVLHAYLFGSYARGEQHVGNAERPESDIDLVVDLLPGKSLFDLSALGLELEEKLGRRFDLVTSPERLHPLIRERVEQDQEVLL